MHACLDEGMPLALLLSSHWQPGCCQAGLGYSVLPARHTSWHQLAKQTLAHAVRVAGVPVGALPANGCMTPSWVCSIAGCVSEGLVWATALSTCMLQSAEVK